MKIFSRVEKYKEQNDKKKKFEKIICDVIETYGNNIQKVVAMEECAELIQAISKDIRYRYTDGFNDEKSKMIHNGIVTEIADVVIMIEQLKIIYNIDKKELEDEINSKIERMEKRLNDKR